MNIKKINALILFVGYIIIEVILYRWDWSIKAQVISALLFFNYFFRDNYVTIIEKKPMIKKDD